jgi:hypothetical protein
MKYTASFKGKNKDEPRDTESLFDRSVHLFPNSAYRNAKQRGFKTSCDVIRSIEADQDFIDLHMPSYTKYVK